MLYFYPNHSIWSTWILSDMLNEMIIYISWLTDGFDINMINIIIYVSSSFDGNSKWHNLSYKSLNEGFLLFRVILKQWIFV
jgi:hypothetical protein